MQRRSPVLPKLLCRLHINSTRYLGDGVVNDLLVGQVTLVSDQQLVDAFRGVTINLREPLLDVVEGVLVCYIIDDNDTVCAAVVRGGDGAETLLSSTVFCDMMKIVESLISRRSWFVSRHTVSTDVTAVK